MELTVSTAPLLSRLLCDAGSLMSLCGAAEMMCTWSPSGAADPRTLKCRTGYAPFRAGCAGLDVHCSGLAVHGRLCTVRDWLYTVRDWICTVRGWLCRLCGLRGLQSQPRKQRLAATVFAPVHVRVTSPPPPVVVVVDTPHRTHLPPHAAAGTGETCTEAQSHLKSG